MSSIPVDSGQARMTVKHSYSIDIVGDSRYPVDRKRIRASVTEVLDAQGLNGTVEMSVMIVGERKMRELNSTYRQLDYATNVLSFCLQDEAAQSFPMSGDAVLRLGDMVICYPVARQQAADKKMLVDDWIDVLVRHSMEHLLGRHHE